MTDKPDHRWRGTSRVNPHVTAGETAPTETRMHAARIGNSERLQRTLNALREAGPFGLTTWELQQVTRNCNPHTDVAEINNKVNAVNGVEYVVTCEFQCVRDGRRIYRYRLAVDAADPAQRKLA